MRVIRRLLGPRPPTWEHYFFSDRPRAVKLVHLTERLSRLQLERSNSKGPNDRPHCGSPNPVGTLGGARLGIADDTESDSRRDVGAGHHEDGTGRARLAARRRSAAARPARSGPPT